MGPPEGGPYDVGSYNTRVFAWAGAGLFAASLTYFLFTYAVTFAETAAGPLRASSVAADVALFTAFALHHSVFARERVRAWVARHLAPPKERRQVGPLERRDIPANTVERSVYVWAASLMLITVCAFWQPIPGVVWDLRGPAAWALRGIQLFGVWLTLRGAAVIDIWDLSGVKPARPTPNSQRPTPTHDAAGSSAWGLGIGSWDFKTDGPYGWVRHPIYLGWFLIVFAMPVMTMTRLLFAALSSAYILIAIPFEERSLLRASEGAYAEYARKVPWKLLPRVY